MESPRRRAVWSYRGSVPYRQGVELQESIRERLLAGDGPEELVLLTHPHVYTLGRNAAAGDIVAGAQWLSSRGVEVVETDRGGQVTYHGPGQLVGYPVIDLDPDRRDVRRYIHDLEDVLVRTLADFGVDARASHEQETIGVWAGEAKIASLGVHIKRWVTTHGFALNVAPDLAYFGGIVPCGLAGVQMTSIERVTGTRPTLEAVARRVVAHFGEIFERDMEAVPTPSRQPASPPGALSG